MSKPNRREFVQLSAGTLAAGLCPRLAGLSASSGTFGLTPAQSGAANSADKGKKPLRLGLIIHIGNDPDAAMAKIKDLGLPTAQIFISEFTSGLDERLRRALDKNGIEATALVVGGPGKEVWDFYDGPLTIGLVPRETRAARVAHIKNASDFAKQCGEYTIPRPSGGQTAERRRGRRPRSRAATCRTTSPTARTRDTSHGRPTATWRPTTGCLLAAVRPASPTGAAIFSNR